MTRNRLTAWWYTVVTSEPLPHKQILKSFRFSDLLYIFVNITLVVHPHRDSCKPPGDFF